MKIAIVCFNLKWQAGGTRLIYSLAHGLQKLGHAVVIYTPDFSPDAFPDLREGLHVKVVDPAHPFSWNKKISGLWAKITHKMREERLHTDTGRRIASAMDSDFDVVNLHDFAYKVAPFYHALNPRTKIIWTENDPPYMYLPKKNFFYDRLSRLFNIVKDFTSRRYFAAIDSVAVLDFYNERWAKERGLAPVVVRSGVDFENFYAPARERKDAQGVFRLFSLGALNPYRRFEDLMQATKLLRDRGRNVETVIIAKDIWSEHDYREKLLAFQKELGAESFVHLNFAGASNEELRASFREAHAFVLTTYLPYPRNGYGWGLTNFEAMASGLPLIIYRTSTATEVLTHRENALITEPCDPEGIAREVEFLIDHPEEYNRITRSGQEFVKERISWDAYAKNLLQLLDRS